MSTGSYEMSLELMGTVPGGFASATVPFSSGTIAMDRSWAPAVQARFTVPFTAFDLASWQLIDSTVEAKFGRLEVTDLTAGRVALWNVTLRTRTHDVKAGTVEIVAYSYESLVQDYGSHDLTANYTDVAAWPSTLSIIQDSVQVGAGVDAAPAGAWTAPVIGNPGNSSELRFIVPGTGRWDHIAALAAQAPGGIVQHYGYANNDGDSLHWLMTNPGFELAPGFAYLVPAEPDPDLGPSQGSAEIVEWQTERSREAPEWGDAVALEYPGKQTSGSVVFTTSGYVMDYDYNQRGTAGPSGSRRRQAQHTVRTRSTPDLAGRDAAASRRLTRIAPRAVGQTYTQPLDVRLLPWQVHLDENSVSYMVTNVMHNLGDGTSAVTVNRM